MGSGLCIEKFAYTIQERKLYFRCLGQGVSWGVKDGYTNRDGYIGCRPQNPLICR